MLILRKGKYPEAVPGTGTQDRRVKRHRTRILSTGAFTLVEMMVVLLLFLVLLTMIYLFQQGAVGSMSSTERKEDAIRTTHSVYAMIHQALINADMHWCPKKLSGKYEEDPVKGVPLLMLPQKSYYFDQKESGVNDGKKYIVRKVGALRFYRRNDHVVPFVVAADCARKSCDKKSFREKSALYSAVFLQHEAAQDTYEAFHGPVNEKLHQACLGGFPAIMGFAPPEKDGR